MFYEVQYASSSQMLSDHRFISFNSLAIAKIYDNLAILSTLHFYAKIIKQLAVVIDEGCKVVIKMFTLY